ncbi:MAG: hypothetical protein ACT4OD_00465 [Candidatus Nitrosotenuis sp.]
MNAIIFASILGLACVFLMNQSAFAESIMSFVPLVTLVDDNAGYLINNDQATIKKVKSFSIKLLESMTLDSGDKKSDDKKKDAKKKDTKKKETKKKDVKKKNKEIKKSTIKSKTKHDTVKNSINNVR